MNDILLIIKSKRKSIFFFFFLFFAGLSTASNLFSFAQFKLDNKVYIVSAADMMISRGFNYNDYIVPIHFIFKLILFASMIIPIVAICLTLSKKNKISSYLLLLGALVEISLVFMIYMFKNLPEINEVEVYFTWPFFTIIISNVMAALLSILIVGIEELAELVFFLFAFLSVFIVSVITIYIFVSGVPAISRIGFNNFIFGTEWNPDSNKYGILPLILSSIIGTIGAILIGVPIGILTAVFLSEMQLKFVPKIVRPTIQLLAGIPSVVYGFFGMLIIVPAIRKVFKGMTIGHSLLAVIMILSIMILPTVVSISENALRSVPDSYREASLALGATKITTIFKIVIPAAKSGILSGIVLGVGRAIGETMAVIMVAGNVVNMPHLLKSVRLLTTGIVLELPYSTGIHRQALFSIGLVLFVFIVIINISFTVLSGKNKE